MLLLHVDYSELKAVKAQRMKNFLSLPQLFQINLDRGPSSERELSPEITLLKKKKLMKDIGSAPSFFSFYLAVQSLNS